MKATLYIENITCMLEAMPVVEVMCNGILNVDEILDEIYEKDESIKNIVSFLKTLNKLPNDNTVINDLMKEIWRTYKDDKPATPYAELLLAMIVKERLKNDIIDFIFCKMDEE